jgi:hydroxyacylglutathione hydrolase
LKNREEEIVAIQIRRVGGQFSCYLIKTDQGFILIDTGTPPNRKILEKDLLDAGCVPGNLLLILLTNGGLDGSGNCAYLREKFNTQAAVHAQDAENLTKKIDYWPKREYILPIYKNFEVLLRPLAMKMIRNRDLFTPDYCMDENFDLSKYRLNARIFHLPGYTRGSVGILTPDGDFFSGNTLIHSMGSFISPYVMTNYKDLYASLAKIKKLNIKTVYPCMGRPFLMERFLKSGLGRRIDLLSAL